MAITSRPSVTLRDPLQNDISVFRALRTDQALQHLLLAYPGQSDDTEAWLLRRQSDANGLFKTVASENNQALGFVQIVNIHQRGQHGHLGICIAPEQRGKNIGTLAIAQVVALAQQELGLRKLMLEVRADNSAAMAAFQKVGFALVGYQKQHYFDGQALHDVALMEMQLPTRTGK